MSLPLLVVIALDPEHLARLEAGGFELHVAVNNPKLIETVGPEVRAVLTNGSTGLSAEQIAGLPKLEVICALGAGYENIDLAAAAARGVVVTNGPGVNNASVADHAMMLMMAIARGVVQADAAVRRGEWAQSRQMRPSISGKKLGILGLGSIGEQIAQRAGLGFGMEIGYHSRKPREAASGLYFPSPVALAQWSDFLVVATPGGAATAGLVDAAVLDALGVEGFLVNIARGSVVNTDALIDAVEHGRIAGAALDVVEGEPTVPSSLLKQRNVIFTPHIAGRSPEAVLATVQLALDNLQAHFDGRPVLTPIKQP
ncbi:lactate dehydrogenase-like 2-hydroxyacid dehydrogenase [Pseudomonas sp. JUb42]|jgi:lactate dehydrogenase-like 2-hydroxyacid dehydrogenase|uniref:2-hydroxyacid dehydrogenase n=1 Tax=Pseudomonas sp. JUb42 TaxID=2940611 RepID=UPI0021695845|nr:2-hydroxyacid dehydrogenase [Pseudomonas sp. JUb42]MCS3472402.1 lactate dehydrogenase-like 2-hydroxyacid dehydrogenase [Pseudomonas sp. JUb42]